MTQTFKIPVAAALIVSIALLGVRSSAFSQTTQSSGFTGEEVYRGLVWGDGPVSALLPEVWSMDAATASSYTQAKMTTWNDTREHVIAEIISKYPTFMSYFGEEVQSGDHLRVQAALSDASAKTVAVLNDMGHVDSNGDPNPDLCAFKVFAVVYVVVAIAVVLVAMYFVPRPGTPGSQQSALYQETLVNHITQRLATP